MKKLLLSMTMFAGALQLYGQSKTVSGPAALPRPKLVVGIVADQMRWDYLYRYYARYQQGGFKRLLNKGFSCENTHISYLPTETAPGHAAIYTGSVPAIHGISSNYFYIQSTGKYMYCTEDTAVSSIGTNSRAGLMSPRNLQASTITDELKLATNFGSKIIGIALKDRGSILPAGHTPNAAYWFDDVSGNWITSSFYMNQLPEWVNRFNAQKKPAVYLAEPWKTLYPIASYQQSTADNAAFELSFKGEALPVFPHNLPALKGDGFGLIRSSPQGNSLTLDFAKHALIAEQLGKDDITDFLAISLSSTDYAGHQFGPNSIEAEDIYLRLDEELAQFFKYLDTHAGQGNYTVFLTADHGAAHNASFLQAHLLPAGIWNPENVKQELNKFLAEKHSASGLVLSTESGQINLNKAAITKGNLNENAVIKDCINWLGNQPGVLFAADMKEIQAASIPVLLRERIINGYNSERNGNIQFILKPGWYSSKTAGGTTHGTSAPYDTHIPLIFMGWGIKPGRLNRETSITDIAATLAALLHIQMPNGSIGTVITEVLKP